MNAELESRWRQGLRPFDGPVLVIDDVELAEAALLSTVRLALGLLHGEYGTSDLYANEDWHSHDGFIKDARSGTWSEALSWTRDADHLRQACSDDTYVHTLVFPGNFAFCLRYWAGGENDNLFDLCAERSLLERLALSLRASGIIATIEPSAKEYFDRAYAG